MDRQICLRMRREGEMKDYRMPLSDFIKFCSEVER